MQVAMIEAPLALQPGSVAEKTLWLRAISNVKVKLRHASMPTSDLELRPVLSRAVGL